MLGLQGEWLCGRACPYYRRRLPRPKDEQDCHGRLGFDLARTSFATRTTRPRPLDSPLPRASRALACGVHGPEQSRRLAEGLGLTLIGEHRPVGWAFRHLSVSGKRIAGGITEGH